MVNKQSLIFLIILFLFIGQAGAEQIGTASYYTVESCKREGTSGIMANGKELNDEDFTAASWDYKFGRTLRITCLDTGKVVLVKCTDRGPAKRLYKKGRIIDLSRAAFKALAPLKRGIIRVSVEAR